MALDFSELDDVSPIIGKRQPPPARSATAAKAPLSAFEEDPNNPRTEFDTPDFETFVADVQEHGILQPIVVRVTDTGKLRIRFGARRYRAAQRLRLAAVPYVVADDERQYDDYAQVAENERREGLAPLDLARFIERKIAQGEKKKDIAAKLKLDPSGVTHLLSLAGAGAFLLEIYHSRRCRQPKYLYDLRILHDRSPELVERRCAAADEIDRQWMKQLAQEINSDGKVAAPKPESVRITTEAIASGRPVVSPSVDKPQLIGCYRGRAVTIVPERIRVRFEDGTEQEVAFDEVS